nr:MAG: zinc-ribbon containing domain protein [Bacteriophage sp.]
MKFTKRAYVKVWQNCPEDEREDTTITLLDYEDTNELNSIPVALLYLLERYAFVDSIEEFDILETYLTSESFDLIGFVKTYRDMLSKTGDFWTPMKFITASPKPVDDIPPVSYCPRCGALIWPDTTQRCINGQPENATEYYRRILEIYKNSPDPQFCHNCGQRFTYVGQNLACKHQSNRADILRTLKLKAETQPTFDLAEFNQ